jgi:magnesium chelatase subunit D
MMADAMVEGAMVEGAMVEDAMVEDGGTRAATEGDANQSGGRAWSDALTALALFAIDPMGLGGISLRAGAGPVRDRWLTLPRPALPSASPIRRLPAHAGDDRILGGLDLTATLLAGRPVVQPGLLTEADRGVVILAMAERIMPAVAARLSAAMDLGFVAVSRDGLTSQSPARFGLIALDEGIAPDECPPFALLDRMAFHIDVTIVSLRDATEPTWDAKTLSAARDRLAAVTAGEPAVDALCGTAMALGIDSIRAPILALRAARAAAAFAGRYAVTEADLILASRLVLAPRARCVPPADEPDTKPEEAPPEAPEDHQPDSDALLDRPLEDVVLDATLAALPRDLLARLTLESTPVVRSRQSGRMGQFQLSSRRGRPIGVRQGRPRAGTRLHLLETLNAAAPWQPARRRAGSSGDPGKANEGQRGTGRGATKRIMVHPDDFRIVRFRQRTETSIVFAVDASGSTALHRLGEAKGAVELLLADCYARRDHVALIAFRGRDATLLLPPTRSLTRAKRCLAGLPGGGATPLAAGIDAAVTLADTERRRGRTPVIVFLTDGRANMTRNGSGGRQCAETEALVSARAPRDAGFIALLVDTSPRPNPFARTLADVMRARYVPLPRADASTLTRAVRSVAAA